VTSSKWYMVGLKFFIKKNRKKLIKTSQLAATNCILRLDFFRFFGIRLEELTLYTVISTHDEITLKEAVIYDESRVSPFQSTNNSVRFDHLMLA